ncbi:DapH/DapD/GlmU-related protein [Alistipes ihumii]|uniref:DapH/DapD/GlmU-related protein n=1 Tax=Alistipes ihumii TaxID=1470347 RepID=UPI003AF465CB
MTEREKMLRGEQFETLDPQLSEDRRPVESCRPVAIGDDCWIGGGAILCPGVRIGPRSVVGAGSVVVRDVEPDVVVAGNPARVVRRLK